MKKIAAILATLAGVGFSPIAPGTAASAACALAYKYALYAVPWPFYLAGLGAVFFAGTAASTVYAASLKLKDPGRIVIDEACGQLLALFLVPAGWLPVGLAFVFFRFFDIIKPPPIRRFERLAGGWGIMADDVAAGAAAGILVHVILAFL
jgi:phosphatidylglycerophosphatase A